jgi:hypothetical protein
MSFRMYSTRSAPAGWILVKFYIGSPNQSVEKFQTWFPPDKNSGQFILRSKYFHTFDSRKKYLVARHQCKGNTFLFSHGKNTTRFVLSIANMHANNDTKRMRCCFQLQKWLHERVTLCVTSTLPILSVLMHETRMRITKVTPGGHVVHTSHTIVVMAQQLLMDLGSIFVDVLRSSTFRHTTFDRPPPDE